MSGINDYNKHEGNPTVRVGNWYEERSLMDYTGLSRGTIQSAKGAGDTAKRVVEHSHNNDHHQQEQRWTSSQHAVHKRDLTNDVTPVATLLPSRKELKTQNYYQKAQELYEEELRRKEEEKHAEALQHFSSHRPPINRQRTLQLEENIDFETQDTLSAPAITIHSETLSRGGQIDKSTAPLRGYPGGLVGLSEKQPNFINDYYQEMKQSQSLPSTLPSESFTHTLSSTLSSSSSSPTSAVGPAASVSSLIQRPFNRSTQYTRPIEEEKYLMMR